MIPNDFFDIYREFSRYTSSIYLIAQAILVIDFAYSWNNRWLANFEQDTNSDIWMFWLFFFSGAMWIGSLTTTVLNYFWFSTTSGCPLNVGLITVTLILGILYTMYSISAWVEAGSLLTSSAVNLYCVFLCWYAMVSEPDEECNDWTSRRSTIIIEIVSIIVTLITVLYLMFQKKGRNHQRPILEKIAAKVLANEGDDDSVESRDRSLAYFHVFMSLLGANMGMMLTNWGGAMVIGSAAVLKK